MADEIRTFLMFQGGEAEEAMSFYISLFPDSAIERIERYGAQAAGKEDTVVRADFRLNGQRFICIDSPVRHGFSFTPSVSLFVDCGTEEEIDRLFAALSDGGEVMMPLGEYAFAARYAWLSDRFGVSWQMSFGGA